MMSKQSSFLRGTSTLAEPTAINARAELPIIEKMAAKGGIATLVKSALNKLKT